MAKQTPNFRGQQAADLSSVATQRTTADNLIDAIGRALNPAFGGGDTPGDILRTKGKLSTENRQALARGQFADQFALKQAQGQRRAGSQLNIGRGEIDQGSTEAFRTRRSRAQSKINRFQEDQQRSDIAQIFGRNLSQSVGHAALNTGSAKERAPKRSGFDKFLDGVNKGISTLFCWVAREVLGTETDDWMLAREWMLNNATDEQIKLYLHYGEATAQRLTPSETLSLKPLFEGMVQEERDNG